MSTSVLAKVAVAGLLVLALLIPLGMIRRVVEERTERRDSAIAEVSGRWGPSQTLLGPVLTIPYRHRFKEGESVLTRTELAHALPDSLKVEGTVVPSVRHRGIFSVVLYDLDVSVRGVLSTPSSGALRLAPEDVSWDQATLSIGLSDTRGIRQQPMLTWGEKDLPFQPGPGALGLTEQGIHAQLPGLSSEGGSIPFAFRLRLQGSQTASFVPVGIDTEVALRSAWPHPSFTGAFLPETRTITPQGFTASWRVSQFGRSFPQLWKTSETSSATVSTSTAASSFGVLFFHPADHYQQAVRCLKYGVLFVVLTFTAFFLFEIFCELRLHPLQYLLVGCALSVFYLLLLSLSEHLGFTRAYLLATLGTVALVSGYCSRILATRTRALGIGGLLVTLYGYLFILLRLEDYALLLGSLALFVVLAAVMYLTRGVDWYGVSFEKARG